MHINCLVLVLAQAFIILIIPAQVIIQTYPDYVFRSNYGLVEPGYK